MSRLRRTIDVMRTLNGDQRSVHLKLLIMRALGRRRDALPSKREGIKKVLFVCHANIMRSAIAEACFSKLASEQDIGNSFEVYSAGIFARPGLAAERRAQEIAASMGLSLENHSARQLTPADIESADLVCVMDLYNETVCLSRFPHAREKLVLLGAFGRRQDEGIEILDHYSGTLETVRACFGRISYAVDALWAEVTRSREKRESPDL